MGTCVPGFPSGPSVPTRPRKPYKNTNKTWGKPYYEYLLILPLNSIPLPLFHAYQGNHVDLLDPEQRDQKRLIYNDLYYYAHYKYIL